jgi:hypothetical protein
LATFAEELRTLRTETARQTAEAADEVRAANQAARDSARRAEEQVAEIPSLCGVEPFCG